MLSDSIAIPTYEELLIPQESLETYYLNIADEEQEALNRADLQEILRADWAKFSSAELGLIALLCNRLLN